MSGTISFPGMSSGQDFNSMIDALVKLKRNARVNPLEKWRTSWEKKIETISTVDSTLSSFYTTVRGMDRISELLVRTASSSHSSVLTATASSQAATGSHAIVVSQLAQAEVQAHAGIQNGIQYHSGVADKTDSINDSGTDKTFKYSYDGSTRTITVSDNETLEDLVTSINSDAGNPGVTAKIVSYGGADHLVLVEDIPDGTMEITIDPDGDMTLDGTGTTANLTASTFTQTVNASGDDKVFEIQYGSDPAVEITVPTGTTLNGLKNLINQANMGIRASILNDGGTGTGSVHLVLSGQNSGADYNITFNSGGLTTLDGNSDTENFTDGIFSETLSAQNAKMRVNGFPSSGWIERTSNTVTDVIEGVTLSLVDTGSATITINTDTESIIEKIEAFTEAFNEIRTAILNATYYDADTRKRGALVGNYALQIIKTRLDSLVSTAAPGFKDPDDAYITLQQVGFSTDVLQGSATQGLLLLDTDELRSALESDPDAVADLFSTYFSGVTDSSSITFQNTLYTATAGIYDVEVDTDTQKGRFRLSGGDWGDWVGLSGISGNYTLTGTSGPERGMLLRVAEASGTGTHTAEVRLKNGVVVELSSELEDLLGRSGPLVTLTDNYYEIISNIDKRIEQEERRLGLYEKTLINRFARLDKYISRMGGLSSSLGAITGSQS